ncbi:MAG: TonB-dependent receptor [Alphaproteobacteria bacterium]|nr:TonB-dependent receptor [Alphaproteobacteria bacterium]
MTKLKSSMKSLMLRSAFKVSLVNVAASIAIAFTGTAALVIQAQAQVTTAHLVGTVVTAEKQPAVNVLVTVTHVPSGTVKVVRTNAKGVFNAMGLRVGGPYSISVKSGLGNAKVGNIFLGIGNASNVNITLEATTFEEIVVTGSPTTNKIQMGTSISIGADAIAGIPTASREIYDLVQVDPLVSIDPENKNAISIGGMNNRFNSVTIDGVKQNDDFGLNNGGFPTQRSPISLDVIQRIDINVAPFDVQYNGFLGGNINIVTKSGTNNFHGSTFFDYRSASLTGKKLDGNDVGLNFNEKIYGGMLSGPVIKDKLFFTVGFEELKSTKPIETGPQGSVFANKVPGVTQADLDLIRSISKTKYNFDPGTLTDLNNINEKDRKIFAKIDWNINENNRAQFTYQYDKGNVLNPQNTSVSRRHIALPSQWYNKTEILKSYSLGIFSDWTENFSTEVRVSRKTVTTRQESLKGNKFAQMQINLPTGAVVYIGPDRYRHANKLNNSTWQIKVKGTYYLGDHEITGGFERETLDVFNLFVNDSRGIYTFNSIADFNNRDAASLSYKNAYTNNANDGAARFKYNVNSLYLQDRWTVNDNLTMLGGVRYDWYTTGSTPKFNQNFMNRNGFKNNTTLNGSHVVMPRFAFNYLAGDRTTIRGGIGKFSGGSPNVWVSNTYTNDGVTIVSTRAKNISNVDGFVIPKAVQDALVQGNGSANYMDPNFKIPSVWKFNIAVQHDFDLGETMGDNYIVTAEVLYAKPKNSATWIDAGLVQTGKAMDGRPIYALKTGGKDDLGVTNTDGGSSTVFALSLKKKFENGVDFNVSYAYTDSKDVNPGTSSTATSNYGKYATFDIQHPTAAISNYEVRNRIVAQLNYRKEFFKDLESRFGLLFIAQSGRGFSYTFNGSWGKRPFGDSQSGRDRQLFYVPNNGAEVGLNAADWTKLNSFIKSSGLDKYRGKIAPRNAFNSRTRGNPGLTLNSLRKFRDYLKGTGVS